MKYACEMQLNPLIYSQALPIISENITALAKVDLVPKALSITSKQNPFQLSKRNHNNKTAAHHGFVLECILTTSTTKKKKKRKCLSLSSLHLRTLQSRQDRSSTNCSLRLADIWQACCHHLSPYLVPHSANIKNTIKHLNDKTFETVTWQRKEESLANITTHDFGGADTVFPWREASCLSIWGGNKEDFPEQSRIMFELTRNRLRNPGLLHADTCSLTVQYTLRLERYSHVVCLYNKVKILF